jgi:hypothetical protein
VAVVVVTVVLTVYDVVVTVVVETVLVNVVVVVTVYDVVVTVVVETVLVVAVVVVVVRAMHLAADSRPVELTGRYVLAGQLHEMVEPARSSSNPAGHTQLAGSIGCPPLRSEHASTLGS